MSEVRTCIGCEHFGGATQDAEPYNPHGIPVQVQRGPQCNHPKAASRDLVFGRAFCHNERNATRGCGKQGKLWEAKKNAK